MWCPYTSAGIRIDQDGTTRPCCEFRGTTSDSLAKVLNKSVSAEMLTRERNEMTKMLRKDQWPEGCSTCRDLEKEKCLSHRQRAIANYNKLFSNRFFVDIVLGNECNSDCVMCTGNLSSKIASRLRHNPMPADIDDSFHHKKEFSNDWITREELWVKLSETIENDVVGGLKFLGGEPFMHKHFWELLGSVPMRFKRNITLNITTNGSFPISVEQQKALEEWKGLIINVSADATGKHYEWIRNGLSWETVHRNTEDMMFIPKTTVSINHTLGLFSVTGVPDLYRYAEENMAIVQWIPIQEPSLQRLSNVPPNVLQEVLDEINTINVSKIQNQMAKAGLKKLLKRAIKENTYDPDLVEKLTRYYNTHRTGEMDPKTLRLK